MTSAHQLPLIIYLHGFNSAPQSLKAVQFTDWVAARNLPAEVAVPALSYHPDEAIRQVEALISDAGSREVFLVGSSLGGYYSCWLSQRFGLRAALINPAVRPYELLKDYLGENQNLHTGVRYTITMDDTEGLRRYDCPELGKPENLYVLLQTADETLDYQQAAQKFSGCKMWVTAGGSHSFENFPEVIPSILVFFGFELPEN